MRVEVLPEAQAELLRAALWYEEQRGALGEEFVVAVSTAFDRISEAAESYPTWPGTSATPVAIRKAVLQRFPYLIAFEEHERYVLVLAIAHAKRRPLYWLTRSTGSSRT